MGIDITERRNLPQSFKMHGGMCLGLKNLVDRIMRILSEIEDARPGASGIQSLCSLHTALEKAKSLLQYCSDSSKLYMAVTGDAIRSRGSRAKKALEQCLTDIQSMVPTVLASKINQIVQEHKSTELTLESAEEEAGKVFKELMKRSTSSSVSPDEIRDFHSAALKLHLSTPEAIEVEKRSLKMLVQKLGESEVNKKQILKYLYCLLKKHEKIIHRDYKESYSFPQHHSVNNDAEAGCSEEHDVGFPEQFKCPLSLTVMYDPVIISSGHTFERMRIQKWFDEGNDSCPKSEKRLDDFTMKPNDEMKIQISKWCAKHGLHVQDPAMKQTRTLPSIDFSVSIASFTSSLCDIPDLSCFSLNSSFTSMDSPSFSKVSRSTYFSRMQTIESEAGSGTADSSFTEIEVESLCGLNSLPWDEQSKVIEDIISQFQHNTQALRSISPSKFLKPFITYLKNALERNEAAGELIKGGMDLLWDFLSKNRRAIESLEEDVFKMLSVFLESEGVAEEVLNIFEILSTHPHGPSKITSTGSLSSLMKIAESGAEHLQKQAMITLKNLSSSTEICLEMVSLDFVPRLTYFLQQEAFSQQNVFSKQSIIILKNICNTEKGRVCTTETPGCLASIAELLDSNVPAEQEAAISILLQLCVEKMEYCYLVVREATEIYSSLLMISKNGTEEAKIGASELLRSLEEVNVETEEEQQQEYYRPEEEATEITPEVVVTSQVVTSVAHEEPIVTTPSSKKSGLFSFKFSSLKKKKSR